MTIRRKRVILTILLSCLAVISAFVCLQLWAATPTLADEFQRSDIKDGKYTLDISMHQFPSQDVEGLVDHDAESGSLIVEGSTIQILSEDMGLTLNSSNMTGEIIALNSNLECIKGLRKVSYNWQTTHMLVGVPLVCDGIEKSLIWQLDMLQFMPDATPSSLG